MDTDTTRRSLLRLGTGAAVAVATVLVPAAAGALSPTSTNPRMLRAIALWERLNAECARFDSEVEVPARKAWKAACDARPIEVEPPHRQSATTFENAFGETVRLSTANVGTAGIARRVKTDPAWADMGGDDWQQAHHELAAAADERDAIIAAQRERKQAHDDAMRDQHRIREITARSAQLFDRQYRVWNAIVAMPAAGLADIDTKLQFFESSGYDDEEAHVLAAVAKDVRRLAREA